MGFMVLVLDNGGENANYNFVLVYILGKYGNIVHRDYVGIIFPISRTRRRTVGPREGGLELGVRRFGWGWPRLLPEQ